MGLDHAMEGTPVLQQRLISAVLDMLRTGSKDALRRALNYANNVLADGANEGHFEGAEDVEGVLEDLAGQMRKKAAGATVVYLGDGGFSRLIISFRRSGPSGEEAQVELNGDASLGVRQKWENQ